MMAGPPTSLPWFRLYHRSLDDPKVQEIPGELFKRWVNLLSLANLGTPRGLLPGDGAVAFRLRITTAEARETLADLQRRGLIDATPEGLMPHDWDDWQYESDDINARVRKHREKGRAAGPDPEASPPDATALPVKQTATLPGKQSVTLRETLHETPPDTESEAETDPDTEADPEREGSRDRRATKRRDKRAPARAATTAPGSFPITAEMAGWAAKNCPDIDIERETLTFLAKNRSKGRRYVNWVSAWEAWMLNEFPKAMKRTTPGRSQTAGGGNGGPTLAEIQPARTRRNIEILRGLGDEED